MDIINFKRGKKRYPNDFTAEDVYKYYKSSHKNPVSSELHRKILYDFHSNIFHRLIYEGESIRLFSNIGTVRIRKTKRKIKFDKDGKIERKYMNIDWLKSKILWSTKYPDLTHDEIMKIAPKERGMVYNTNDHTSRCVFKFYWDKSTVKLPNKSFYSFDVLRVPGNRELAIYKPNATAL